MNKRLPDSVTQRKPAKRFAPMPSAPIFAVWAPRMTPQEKQAHDKYVAEHNCPF